MHLGAKNASLDGFSSDICSNWWRKESQTLFLSLLNPNKNTGFSGGHRGRNLWLLGQPRCRTCQFNQLPGQLWLMAQFRSSRRDLAQVRCGWGFLWISKLELENIMIWNAEWRYLWSLWNSVHRVENSWQLSAGTLACEDPCWYVLQSIWTSLAWTHFIWHALDVRQTGSFVKNVSGRGYFSGLVGSWAEINRGRSWWMSQTHMVLQFFAIFQYTTVWNHPVPRALNSNPYQCVCVRVSAPKWWEIRPKLQTWTQ